MKLLAALAGVPAWLVAQAAPSGLDGGTLVVAYGAAAPFAALCMWRMFRADARADRLETKVDELNAAALRREQQLVAGLGPRLYDTALLVSEAAKAPAPVDPHVAAQLDELTNAVRSLADGMAGGGAHG